MGDRLEGGSFELRARVAGDPAQGVVEAQPASVRCRVGNADRRAVERLLPGDFAGAEHLLGGGERQDLGQRAPKGGGGQDRQQSGHQLDQTLQPVERRPESREAEKMGGAQGKDEGREHPDHDAERAIVARARQQGQRDRKAATGQPDQQVRHRVEPEDRALPEHADLLGHIDLEQVFE